MGHAGAINAGLIGRGIAKSESPAIHSREAAAQGIDLHYDLIDFDVLKLADDALGAKLQQLADLGFSGVNITHPFKQAVMPLLDEVEATAKALGAVNCVSLRDGKKVGSNSDWLGFSFLMQQELPGVSLERVALVGAGGAGSATAYALLHMGVGELRIFDADQERAEVLAARLEGVSSTSRIVCKSDAAGAILGADGIVQASPIGMAAYPGTPFDPDMLSARQWLADIIYFPRETEIVRVASARGLRVAGGAAMAVGQAGLPFSIFTGAEPDLERMFAEFVAADQASPDEGKVA